jgi:hypothetical protein
MLHPMLLQRDGYRSVPGNRWIVLTDELTIEDKVAPARSAIAFDRAVDILYCADSGDTSTRAHRAARVLWLDTFREAL